MLGEKVGIGEARIHTCGNHGVQYDDTLPFDAQVDGIDVFQGQPAIQAFLGSQNPCIGFDYNSHLIQF